MENCINNSKPKLAFQQKHELACNKAYQFVSEWVKENKKDCNEIYFDRGIISKEKDFFKYTIRAVEQYLRRAHLFELKYNKNSLEISFINTSQNPKDLQPGDLRVMLQPSW